MMLISASNSRVEGFASTTGIHVREVFLISLQPSNSVGCEVENTAFRELTASERKNSKERSGLKIQGIRHSSAGFREGHYRAHSSVGTWRFGAQRFHFWDSSQLLWSPVFWLLRPIFTQWQDTWCPWAGEDTEALSWYVTPSIVSSPTFSALIGRAFSSACARNIWWCLQPYLNAIFPLWAC